MKKLTLLTILLISFCGFSQEEETQTEIKKPKKVRKIRPDHEFSFYATQHLNLGDNFLSKGHKPYVGFGTHKNIINVYSKITIVIVTYNPLIYIHNIYTIYLKS